MALIQNPDSPVWRWLKRGLLIALVLAVTGFALRNVILGTPVDVPQPRTISFTESPVQTELW